MANDAFSVIGLMSGTSMDGIDVAHLRTDGQTIAERGTSKTYAYSSSTLKALKALIAKGESAPEAEIQEVEALITQAHVAAANTFREEFNLVDVDLVGFHGHTFIHRPDQGYTRQLGLGQQLANDTNIPVVYDFRSNDMKQGGQGAPLAPIYHQALLGAPQTPCAMLNIGGVANVTYVGPGDFVAFDTGPGNALIDDWVRSKTDLPYDRDGAFGTQGQVEVEILQDLLAHPYFTQKPPKSLDRNDFRGFVKRIQGLSVEDGCATLAAFTAKTIAASVKGLPHPPVKWVLCGGGRHNRALVTFLKTYLEGTTIIFAEEYGYNGDAIEAELMGYLAVRSLHKLPLSFPTTTGAQAPTTGGVYVEPVQSGA